MVRESGAKFTVPDWLECPECGHAMQVDDHFFKEYGLNDDRVLEPFKEDSA
jgi:Zn ribbon nucleic-acid-binding protein